MPLCFCVLLNRTGDALVVLVFFFSGHISKDMFVSAFQKRF